MSIKINLGAWNSVFAVPSKVVDEGLKFADGAKLRVLLYILCHSGKELNDDIISKNTGVNATDIPEILDYWVSMDILSKSEDVYLPTQSYDSDISTEEAEVNCNNNSVKENTQQELPKTNTTDDFQKQRFVVGKPQKPDFSFTAQKLSVDKELQFLVEEAQNALGKVLSNSDISTLLMLMDTCGLPLDVILMLIQYCISIDKANMRTVEKIGVQWANDEIYSVEAADNKIMQIRQTNKNFSIVSAAFGIKNAGSPTKKQLEYGNKWVGDWKFSPEMLREAYERCVDTKGNMNFRYIDGILKRWYSNNLHNLDELNKFEKSSVKSQKKQKSSYDINELEKIDTLDNL